MGGGAMTVVVDAPTVAVARAAGRPLVALESSVLAQGLPAPANREADRRMRAAVAARGAVPAVTAVVRGVPTLGLEGRRSSASSRATASPRSRPATSR